VTTRGKSKNPTTDPKKTQKKTQDEFNAAMTQYSVVHTMENIKVMTSHAHL